MPFHHALQQIQCRLALAQKLGSAIIYPDQL